MAGAMTTRGDDGGHDLVLHPTDNEDEVWSDAHVNEQVCGPSSDMHALSSPPFALKHVRMHTHSHMRQHTHTHTHTHPHTHTPTPTHTHTHTHTVHSNTPIDSSTSFSHRITSVHKTLLKLPWLSLITSASCHADVAVAHCTPALFLHHFFSSIIMLEEDHCSNNELYALVNNTHTHTTLHALRLMLFKAMLMLGKTLLDGQWLSQKHQITTVSCGDSHSVFLCKVRMRICDQSTPRCCRCSLQHHHTVVCPRAVPRRA